MKRPRSFHFIPAKKKKKAFYFPFSNRCSRYKFRGKKYKKTRQDDSKIFFLQK